MYLLGLGVAALTALSEAAEQQVLRVFRADPAVISELAGKYDVWGQSHDGRDIDVLVGAKNSNLTEAAAKALSNAEVLIEDVEAFLDAECRRNQHRQDKTMAWSGNVLDDSFFDTFRTHDDHLNFSRSLASEFPGVIEELGSIGQTIEGMDILTYKIHGRANAVGDKPSLYLQSTVHAREWLATTSLAWTMKKLAEGYGSNETITEVLDKIDIYVTPLVGPALLYSTSQTLPC